MSRITLKDVARESGVSASTVSFVLNKDPHQTIPQATQDRVRAAARALGYRPNRMAKALREGTSRMVLLNTGVYPGSQSMANLIAGIDDELRQHGYSLLVTHYVNKASIPELLMESVRPHLVIDLSQLNGSDPDSGLDDAWNNGMEFHAATQVRHLIDKGHSHIAYVFPAHQETNGHVELRMQNFGKVAESLGLPEPVFIFVEPQRDTAGLVFTKLKADHPKITAMACYNDEVALLVLSAMQSVGLVAPTHWAVIGFDESPFARLWSPTLTTVRIKTETIGHRIARSVLGLPLPQLTFAASEVVPGEST